MNVRIFLLLIINLFISGVLHAQGIKISTNPGPADSSSGFEVDFTDRGFLTPRMTEGERLAIAQPANALLVYQTDGAKPGFYFNYGTPAVPEWRRLLTGIECDTSDLEYRMTTSMDTVKLSPGSATGDVFESLVLTFQYIAGNKTDVQLTLNGVPPGVIYDLDGVGSAFPSSVTVTFHASFTDAVPGNYPITFTAHCGLTPQADTVILSILPFKRVFVTSAAVQGNFGGVPGGDYICQTAANSQSLGGTWRAWLSTSTDGSPGLTFNKVDYPYVRMDGAVIAVDFDGLFHGSSNSLVHPINMDEKGDLVPNDEPVWSRTQSSGQPYPVCCPTINNTKDCFEFTSAVGDGHIGRTGYVNGGNWSAYPNGYQPCNQSARLYCFEQ